MAAPDLSLRRRLLYAALVTVVGTAAILGLLEAGLRIAGYGASPHFARREVLPGGTVVWRDNGACTVPYFSPALARRPMPFRLPEKKAPGTYRIFVLGSSAAMGDPEPSFSLARVLEAMLGGAYPGVRFEVVNAGITAINSHLVRGIAADCARLEPDLFIVYDGQNEVIGPFGPSGVFAPFLRSELAIRCALWLEGTRTSQLIRAAGRALTGRRGAPADWGGMGMFLGRRIASGDPRLDAVRDHFRANLLAIAAAARRAGAGALVCTTLSNQRDFAPFSSEHAPGLSPADLARWQAAVDAATTAVRASDPAGAERQYRDALAIDGQYAEVSFRLGRLLLAAGRDEEARHFLRLARDLDTLRFRADSRLNDMIRDLGRAGIAGLTVVDVAGALAAESPHGIPGDDLLYEHVHLTLHGTCAAARALIPSIAADLQRRGLAGSAAPALIDDGEVRRRLAFTTYDQAMIALSLLARFRAPPFTGQSDQALRIDTWSRRAESANALLARPEALPVLREIYREAIALSPEDWVLARNAGAMLVARGDPADALPLLQRAAAWIDDDVDTLVALGWANQKLGNAAAAKAAFDHARALAPHYPGIPRDASGP